MTKFKWVRGRRYAYYDSYGSWREAYDTAKWNGIVNKKNKYFIEKVEEGVLFPRIVYKLYMSHVIRYGVFG